MHEINNIKKMIAELAEDMANGKCDRTVGGHCSSCGHCCSNILPLSMREIRRIRQYVLKHGIKEQFGGAWMSKEAAANTCPFRSEASKSCLIYPVRPAICKDFLCSKPANGVQLDQSLFKGKFIITEMRGTFFRRKGDGDV